MKSYLIAWADDDPDDIALVREILSEKRKDVTIREMRNGRQLIDYLQVCEQSSSFPCLIVLDINMPIMDGRDTLAAIKSHPAYSAIPVIVFTTSGHESDRTFCERFGVKMVTKPNAFHSLEEIVLALLEHCR